MADDLTWTASPADLLRPGPDFDLATFDRGGTPGFDGDKDDGKALTAERGLLLSELQERLFAEGRSGGERSVLLVLQGLDTAGKGGIVRHVMGMVDPQGIDLHSFGVPTEEEKRHNYLWRIRRALPRPGRIGVFDRSHYEDVLVARVDELVEEEVWRKRYAEINRFERTVASRGTTIVKVALMVSKQEQGLRLLERLDRPDKHWKFNPNDVTTRKKWDDYQEAYADVFARTNTDVAPWHVIPADKKWYARLAVTELVTQALIDMNPRWPRPRWRVATQTAALLRTMDPDNVPTDEEREETVEETLADEREFAEALAEVAASSADPQDAADEQDAKDTKKDDKKDKDKDKKSKKDKKKDDDDKPSEKKKDKKKDGKKKKKKDD
ncbi:PPK2 family polyphosphate kinase [Georgenia sp. Z1344]|uniref:PPK2 family polyphosphate kinase n=1 Tax=Georgenia sp. Z1344 TaxID=3416706 RepID=UPI003CE6FDBD